ncbi:MAG: MarR family winged helix-turn-helix transcriptional regulator [Bryobacteraceae bacterium]
MQLLPTDPNLENPVLEHQLQALDSCFDAIRKIMMRNMAPPQSDVELSPQDGRALMTLADRGRVTMTDFSELLGVPLSTATRQVERLIDKGLAIRSRIEDDRRVVRVELSDEGRRLQQVWLTQRLSMSRTMLEPLTHGEREIFIELMTKITRPRPE